MVGMETKVTSIGNSLGVILSKEMLARLRLGKGDRLYAVETTEGLLFKPYDPEFVAQMEAAERIMREDRSLLKKLAQ
jgi:putative addiction module antidote